jgi:acetyltransferase-like isoleucine patch superfamily enzyme
MTYIIDPSAKVSPHADLEISVRGSVFRIGKRTEIDSFVKFKPAGGNGNITIGDDCFINSGTVIYSGNGIAIGNNVLVAANCTFAPTDHNFSDKESVISSQGFSSSKDGIVIENDVWIGANCVILDGAKIGTGTVVGAHSLIAGHLEPYSVYIGSPAIRIRKR